MNQKSLNIITIIWVLTLTGCTKNTNTTNSEVNISPNQEVIIINDLENIESEISNSNENSETYTNEEYQDEENLASKNLGKWSNDADIKNLKTEKANITRWSIQLDITNSK